MLCLQRVTGEVVHDRAHSTRYDLSDDAGHHEHGASARMGWARLLKRVFDIDL